MRLAATVLACISISWCTIAAGQSVAVGTANFQTKLYTTYGADPYYNKTHEVKAEIGNGNKIYCYGIVDTIINRVKYTWAAVVYYNQAGFVPFGHIAFDAQNRAKVDALPRGANMEHLPAAYQASKNGAVADSLHAIKQRETDSLEAIRAKAEAIQAGKDAETWRVKDSIRKRQLALRIAKQGFGILTEDFEEGNYSVDFSVSVVNYTNKTIKYIWFTLAFYNPVNDLIGTKTVTAVGPIKSSDYGAYQFESVFFTKVFDRGSITKVKIQYMDGTFKTFTAAQLEALTFYDY